MEEHEVLKQMRNKELKAKVKKELNALKENIKKQNELYFKLFLKPNDDLIKAIELFIKSKMNIGQFNKIKESRVKYYTDLKGKFKLWN
jgi:hypothetical protein